MDQRTGDGWFSGLFEIFVINTRYLSAKIWTWCEDCFSAEQNHPQVSLQKEEWIWRKERPRSRTAFAAGRLLTQYTNTSGSLEPTILSKTTPTYSLSVFELTIFKKSIQSGTEFHCLWRKSHLMTSWKDCTNWEYDSKTLKTVLELYDLEIQNKLGSDYHRLKTKVNGLGDGGHQGMPWTGGGGLVRVPNVRVCDHLFSIRCGTRRREGWMNILPWYRPVGVSKAST